MDDQVWEKGIGGEVGKGVRELLRAVCKGNDVEILKGHVSRGHVHLFVLVPRTWRVKAGPVPQGQELL